MYTRVLLGNLSLERLIFNKGTHLGNLDSVARSFLMMVGQNYNHSTSHGVGHFLNVHEGPYNKPILPGNFLTNEPGYYEENAFGIRIENDLIAVEIDDKHLGFENITLLPYERNLIDLNIVSKDMREYIDSFHKKVYDTLAPLLKDDENTLNYLRRKTEKL